MQHFAAFPLRIFHFFLAMDSLTCDKWILLAVFCTFFSKSSEKHFTDHTLQMYLLISPQCRMHIQRRLTQISVDIHVRFYHAAFYQITFWDKQCKFWPSLNVYVQSGQCFLQSPPFLKTSKMWKFTLFCVNKYQRTLKTHHNNFAISHKR